MNIHSQDLSSHHTFGFEIMADKFCSISTENELVGLIKNNTQQKMILGGGSNVLFTKKPSKLLVKNVIKGISIYKDADDFSIVQIAGGEIWHEVVQWAVNNDLGGIENLALIPGTMGAAPIQNIGAYGVEIKSVFIKLDAIHLTTGEKRMFSLKECDFGYRDSIFKKEEKGKWCITYVYLKLSKIKHHFTTDYYALKNHLTENKLEENLQNIFEAVIDIRNSKLPNPKEIGNAGSFFKNPIVSEEQLIALKNNFPNMPSYPFDESSFKVAAGWLIDQCQLKGYRIKNVGLYQKQALVLVHYGGGTPQEIIDLCAYIQKEVKKKFGILLDPEVNFIS